MFIFADIYATAVIEINSAKYGDDAYGGIFFKKHFGDSTRLSEQWDRIAAKNKLISLCNGHVGCDFVVQNSLFDNVGHDPRPWFNKRLIISYSCFNDGKSSVHHDLTFVEGEEVSLDCNLTTFTHNSKRPYGFTDVLNITTGTIGLAVLAGAAMFHEQISKVFNCLPE